MTKTYGRLEKLQEIAAGHRLDVDIVYAVRPFMPMGTPKSYFIVAEEGTLLGEPRDIGETFEVAADYLYVMRTQAAIFDDERKRPYYGG